MAELLSEQLKRMPSSGRGIFYIPNPKESKQKHGNLIEFYGKRFFLRRPEEKYKDDFLEKEDLLTWYWEKTFDTKMTSRDAFVRAVKLVENQLLIEQGRKKLPEHAPELYVGNRGGKKDGENIIDFLRRVWGEWIGTGALTRPDLRRLDSNAYTALNNYLRNHELPSDIRIPKLSEVNDMALSGPTPLREVKRLGSASYRRLRSP
jgi:hypothetical protein